MPIKWREFKNLEKNFNQSPDIFEGDDWSPFSPAFPAQEPAIDIYQDKDNLYVEVPLVGINPENVELSVEDNVLTIQGKAEVKKQEKNKDYFRKEIRQGSFSRSIKLPVDVKENKTSAEAEKGILKIILPKAARSTAGAKKVPIKIK